MRARAACLHAQKLQQLQASSEEERRRLETQYKEKLKAYDEKLRDVRRKEREYIVMQKLKQRTEVRLRPSVCVRVLVNWILLWIKRSNNLLGCALLPGGGSWCIYTSWKLDARLARPELALSECYEIGSTRACSVRMLRDWLGLSLPAMGWARLAMRLARLEVAGSECHLDGTETSPCLHAHTAPASPLLALPQCTCIPLACTPTMHLHPPCLHAHTAPASPLLARPHCTCIHQVSTSTDESAPACRRRWPLCLHLRPVCARTHAYTCMHALTPTHSIQARCHSVPLRHARENTACTHARAPCARRRARRRCATA